MSSNEEYYIVIHGHKVVDPRIVNFGIIEAIRNDQSVKVEELARLVSPMPIRYVDTLLTEIGKHKAYKTLLWAMQLPEVRDTDLRFTIRYSALEMAATHNNVDLLKWCIDEEAETIHEPYEEHPPSDKDKDPEDFARTFKQKSLAKTIQMFSIGNLAAANNSAEVLKYLYDNQLLTRVEVRDHLLAETAEKNGAAEAAKYLATIAADDIPVVEEPPPTIEEMWKVTNFTDQWATEEEIWAYICDRRKRLAK